MQYPQPEFSAVLKQVDQCFHSLHLDVTDRDLSQSDFCGVWLIRCSERASCSVSLMKRADNEVMLLLQACFPAPGGKVAKGPRRLYTGSNDGVHAWLLENVMPFNDLVRVTSIMVEVFPAVIDTTQLGALIEQTQRIGSDASNPIIEHVYRVRFPVRQHIVDVYFSVQMMSDAVAISYVVNQDANNRKLITNADVHENTMVQRVYDAIEAIKSRFFVDPDIYHELLSAPGLYGDNVIALPQKTAKTED